MVDVVFMSYICIHKSLFIIINYFALAIDHSAQKYCNRSGPKTIKYCSNINKVLHTYPLLHFSPKFYCNNTIFQLVRNFINLLQLMLFFAIEVQ